jgi:hypothetical protein
MQLWKGPNETALMLMALPTQVDLNKAVTSTDIKDAEVQKTSKVQICGDQPAIYVSMIGTESTSFTGSSAPSGTSATEEKHQIDLLATNARGKTYMAMYIRPVGTPADPAAEGAIHNVCPK